VGLLGTLSVNAQLSRSRWQQRYDEAKEQRISRGNRKLKCRRLSAPVTG